MNCNSLVVMNCSECKSAIYCIIRYQDDINTEHNMKSIGSAALAQWTKSLTRNGQTRVRIRDAHIFDITESSKAADRERSAAFDHNTQSAICSCYLKETS